MDKWIKKDLKHNWHPYTQMKDCESMPPILIDKARGVKLYDRKGKFYYDTISSWWCNVHGHSHPIIVKAIKEQLNKIDHILFAGFTHKSAISLSEKLIAIAPGKLNRVFYSDNGSTAVETALKMSFQYWHNIGKKKKAYFVSSDHGYHGDTIGTMSMGGVDLFNKVFSSLFFSSYKIPAPYCYRCPMNKKKETCNINCTEPVKRLLSKKHNKIAAVILEPLVMAAGGMIVYPKEYLRRVALLAKKYDVHLILDEVAVGFGRTGKMFASEHVKIAPDFLCLSKGITSGYLPLGATLTTEKIYKAFYADYDKKKTFYHGHTYTANPIACSAALGSLEVFKKENTLKKAQETIKFFHNKLEEFRHLKYVGDVRYIGMIGVIELVKNKKTKEMFGFTERIGVKIYKEGLKRNIILRPLGNAIYFYPPLSIKRGELALILKETLSIIKNLKKA